MIFISLSYMLNFNLRRLLRVTAKWNKKAPPPFSSRCLMLIVTSNLIKYLRGSLLFEKELGFVYKGSDVQLCFTTFIMYTFWRTWIDYMMLHMESLQFEVMRLADFFKHLDFPHFALSPSFLEMKIQRYATFHHKKW